MGKLILNGKNYTGNSADGFPPLIYSDDEREVGVWRDGKPLYQRTFRGITSSSDNALSVYSDSEWDVVNCEGNIEESADKIQIGAYLNSSYYCGWYFDKYDNNTLKIFYSNQYKGKDYVITIYYTKTTDTAGSGYWSTNGDRAMHYSTTEQVIGTWIDGKPLYEKTINIGHSASTDYDVRNLNIKTAIQCLGSIEGFGSIPFITPSTNYNITCVYGGGYIQMRIGSSLSVSNDCYVTLRYTKTTD